MSCRVPADHNAARWLEVRFLERRPHRQGRGWKYTTWVGPGWYVLRVCPCHPDQPVAARGFATEAAARCLAETLVAASKVLGT